MLRDRWNAFRQWLARLWHRCGAAIARWWTQPDRWRLFRQWLWLVSAEIWWSGTRIFLVVWACRSSALAVIVGIALIGWTDQARDIVIARDKVSLLDGSILWAVIFWAVIGWYWARMTLAYSFVLPMSAAATPWQKWWQRLVSDHLPRLIGALAIWSVAYAFSTAHAIHVAAGDVTDASYYLWRARIYAVFGLLFYTVVWLRRPFVTGLVSRGIIADPDVANLLMPSRAQTGVLVGLSNPIARLFLGSTIVAAVAAFFLVAADPVGMNVFFDGSVPAVLVGLALTVPVTSMLAILGARRRLPVLEVVAAWLIVAPVIFDGDNHDVRTCLTTRQCAQQLADRMTLEGAFDKWWDRNAKPDMTSGIADSGIVVPPMVMVATAGGASRAGYWTTQVLGEIARHEKRFADRIFLISGVSGGALGATVFRSIVEADRRATGGKGSDWLKNAATDGAAFLDNDFLGPAMAAGFYVDLPASGLTFIPKARWRPNDRATALEQAWEHAWSKLPMRTAPRSFAWTDGFNETFAGPTPWPVLALNGTSVEKGKRIVTSNVKFWTGSADNPANMSGGINRYDTFDITQADIPISTAVTMSARFPVISPTGGLRDKDGTLISRVADGGLFENFGALTLDEVLRYLVLRLGNVQDGARQTAPMVILISSDPSLDQLHLRVDSTPNPAPPDCATIDPSDPRPLTREHPGNGWRECPTKQREYGALLRDPAIALYDGRVARGEAAATALLERVVDAKRAVRDRLVDANLAESRHVKDMDTLQARLGFDDHTDFFHFRQCRVDKRVGPTMSWHNSQAAWDVLQKMLGLAPGDKDYCGNGVEFFRLCMRLTRVSGEAPDDEAATRICETTKHWPKPDGWECCVPAPGSKLKRPYCGLHARSVLPKDDPATCVDG